MPVVQTPAVADRLDAGAGKSDDRAGEGGTEVLRVRFGVPVTDRFRMSSA
jgi:hypothetical protein